MTTKNEPWILLALAGAALGCATARPAESPSDRAPSEGAALQRPDEGAEAGVGPSSETPAELVGRSTSGPRLERAALIRAVIARNPDVASRRHAWQAARQRSRGAGVWEDPMLAYSFAPLSIGAARFGQTVELSQKLPWPGKLGSETAAAERDAEWMKKDIRISELDLALAASLAYDDYWLFERSLDVNAAHKGLLGEIQKSSEAQYSVGMGSLSEPLAIEVEITRLEEQALALRSERDVAVSRLNVLLHRAPETKLPPPPESRSADLTLPPASSELQRRALGQSPELERVGAKVRAAEAEVKAAERQAYPDVTVMASYSTMWADPEHRLMLGVEAPIPLQRAERTSRVESARAKVAEARSETSHTAALVRADIDQARRQVIESIERVKLYDGRLLPAAKNQVAAARTDYVAGKTELAMAIAAERNLREIELGRLVAIAELWRRRARLDRALGRLPFDAEKGGAK